MNQANLSDIPIEDSNNLDEGEELDFTPKESEEASNRVLGQQGIFVATKEHTTETFMPLENFSQELFEEGGIEIIKRKEGQEEEEEEYSL